MNKFPGIFLLAFITATTACGGESANLEQSVQERTESKPETAPDYFLEQIEAGATVEEQAIYLYGIGLAHEKLGNIEEAVNDYLGAEILGYAPATQALQRVRDKIGKDL